MFAERALMYDFSYFRARPPLAKAAHVRVPEKILATLQAPKMDSRPTCDYGWSTQAQLISVNHQTR